ncbi:MAG: oligosaccharide flippase family protein [Nitrospira sp.]|nr:oligosaccharide flippase family protein [Nitrospira sp.]
MSSGTLKHQLIHAFTKLTLLSMLDNAITMITGMVVARGLGAHGYGVFAYARTLVTLPTVLSDLGVTTMIMRSATRSQLQAEWSLLRSLVIRFAQLSVLMVSVVVLVSWLILWMLVERLSMHQTYTVIWLLLGLPFLTLSKLAGAVLCGLNHLVAGAIAGMMTAVVHLTLISLLFGLMPETRLPEYVAFSYLIMAMVSLILLCVVLWRRLPGEFYRGENVYHTREWLRESLPFVLLTGVGYINGSIDVFMLGFFQPAEHIGQYHMALKASMLIMGATQISNTVLTPQFARLYVQRDTRTLQRLVTTSTRLIFLWAFGVALAILLFGKELLVWLVGEQFAGAYPPLVILAVGRLVAVATGPVILMASMTHHEKDGVRALWLSIVLNIILNALLIPDYGITGAAAATMTSLVLRNVYLSYMLTRRIKIRCGIV